MRRVCELILVKAAALGLLSLGLMSFGAQRAQGGIIHVGPSQTFTTITAGIAAASAGDTILIDDGVYSEHLVVDKALTFESVNLGGAIIDGGGAGTLFNMKADATFKGLWLRNATLGIWQRNVGGVIFTVERLIVSNISNTAFIVDNSGATVGGGTIKNSTIVDTGTGIWMDDAGTAEVVNTIFDNVSVAYRFNHALGLHPDHNLLNNVGTVSIGGVSADPAQIIADPLFVNRAAGDYRLLEGSPGIDSGKNVGLSFLGAAPDRGAFEGAVAAVPEPSSLVLLGLGVLGVFAFRPRRGA